ncbi:uncharacterized protein LOC143188203 [Calliopsis andreniformis]|uniref:uncharacterized protein LOC143188203 n=1 Tax=Calliopsis andreniformis TaxID=337506 RepID=UPI003FCDC478
MRGTATFFAVAILSIAVAQEYEGGHALFVRTSPREVRQQSDPTGYLPPYSTQRPPEKPRPFQPPSTAQQPNYSPSAAQNEVTSYPYQRPPTGFSPPNVGFVPGQPSTTNQAPTYTTQNPTYLPPNNQSPYGPPSTSYNPRPTASPSYSNSGSSSFPPFSSTRTSTTYLAPSGYSNTSPQPPSSTLQSGFPSAGGVSTNFGYSTVGGSSPGRFSTPSGFSSTYGYSTQRPSPSFVPTGEGSVSSGASVSYPSGGGPSSTYGYQTERPSPPFPTAGSGPSYDQTAVGGYPSSPGVDASGPGIPGQETGGSSGNPDLNHSENSSASSITGTTGGATVTATGAEDEDDLKHPPHIHALDVECSKTMMTINMEFNRVFDGVIYSKGFFTNPACRYVEQSTGQTKYSFTVSLDSCGTQFINDFEGEAGQAYLENVLVLQNEPGIQEVWDTVRRVRCLWEGNINKALSVNFSVDMLRQEIVTFSGDTAVAKLDIQVGRGPFAPAADGLVKIGETMTLVVTVEGDPAFDLQVRDCLARDDSSTNTIQLTDERGCILKPKLFGAFQKTNDTGNTGASIIAYAYFQAFKFPDVMDLFIECNVELCKTDCEPCPNPNQQIEPGRRRRSVTYTPPPSTNNSAMLLSEPIRVARGFRVIMVDDLSEASSQSLEHLEETAVEEVARTAMNVCMTYSGFYATISLMLGTIVVTTISTVVFYVKLQRVYKSKFVQS